MTRRPKLKVAVAAALLALPLTACGGGSTEPDGNAGSATPTASPTADDSSGGPSGTMGDDDDGQTGPDGSGDD